MKVRQGIRSVVLLSASVDCRRWPVIFWVGQRDRPLQAAIFARPFRQAFSELPNRGLARSPAEVAEEVGEPAVLRGSELPNLGLARGPAEGELLDQELDSIPHTDSRLTVILTGLVRLASERF